MECRRLNNRRMRLFAGFGQVTGKLGRDVGPHGPCRALRALAAPLVVLLSMNGGASDHHLAVAAHSKRPPC